MFVLCLNDMRSPKIEMLTPVCRADTREELDAFEKSERVETYQDDGLHHPWSKSYRKGGPLEWFNLPFFGIEHIVEVRPPAFPTIDELKRNPTMLEW